MRYTKTPVINNSQDFANLKLQKGQWIKLAGHEHASRYHHHTANSDGSVRYVCAFHYPQAGVRFNVYCGKSQRPMTAK